ncbi:Uncharacterised protein [Klebsiella pneumoniae]|nr:Uncharacterised protein [Klebsiella pneumoniae]CAA0320164.1 Uncharacterised protein [Klebsiella pneumoniae]CAA0344380.1 Uncharacterised protein [Klebsiella pneumoniae]SAT18292.1 Uncharacterised protein [Klebsiella pneumoniae]SAT74118.1 Uncharacterised protein [Klebsiella pneumoniae]
MRGKSVMLLAGLASLAQANELNPDESPNDFGKNH